MTSANRVRERPTCNFVAAEHFLDPPAKFGVAAAGFVEIVFASVTA